jgi:hypothetical protein
VKSNISEERDKTAKPGMASPDNKHHPDLFIGREVAPDHLSSDKEKVFALAWRNTVN